MQVAIEDGNILIDGVLLGGLLGVAAEELPGLLRLGAITSVCEQGVDVHQGQYRLTFFYKSRRARLSVDEGGRILQRSFVDFGERSLPRAARRSG